LSPGEYVVGLGATRLALLDDDSLVVARGSSLKRIAPDGTVVWTLDAGAPYGINDVVTAGDRIALIARRFNEADTIAQLDAAGRLRWATRNNAAGLAIAPGGAVAIFYGEVALFDGDGAMRWVWEATDWGVWPPPVAAGALAFHGDRVVAGGWRSGRTPFISVLGLSTP
jgi:hypothetical protein